MLPVLVILLVMHCRRGWCSHPPPFTRTYSYMSQHHTTHTRILILHHDCFKTQTLVGIVEGQFPQYSYR